MLRLARRLRRHGDGSADDGFAMIVVLGTGMVLTLVLIMLLQYTLLSATHSRREQDYLAAMSAAQAGIDDYLSRLNANNTYWQGTDCTNAAMRRPVTGAGAPCGWTSSTPVGWTSIAGTSNPRGLSCAAAPTPPNCAVFHYDADPSQTLFNGMIRLTATGRSNNVSRSVQVSIRRQGFADFLYYSDIESVDPANQYVYGVNNTTARTRCSRHFWDNPPRDTAYCANIYWAANDVVNGPLHSNDALLITAGPTFNGPVSTAYPACAPNAQGTPPPSTSCYRNGGSAAPRFSKGISYASQVQLPPTNSSLRAQTDPATASGTPGCLFTGPTRIHFNANGSMTVWSPYTMAANPGCGSAGPAGQQIPVPNNNVVFVQNVPSTQSTPAAGNCAAGAIGGYPQAGDANYNYGEYDCRAGTVFVDGTLSGRVTIGASNNILIVDNLTYTGGSTGSDSLGLIADNSVEVYHPVSCSRWSGPTCQSGTNMSRPGSTGAFTNPVIDAAMLSLAHSFSVQLYPLGNALGQLNVFGAISQKFRGAVGTFSGTSAVSGYNKNYVYDSRLKFAPPPYYLDPVQTSYGVTTFAEVHPAY